MLGQLADHRTEQASNFAEEVPTCINLIDMLQISAAKLNVAKASGGLRLLTGSHVHIDILLGLTFTASLPLSQIPLRRSYVASRDRMLIRGMSQDSDWPKSVVLVRESYRRDRDTCDLTCCRPGGPS